ncbi:alanine racemase [Aerococcaceae bacterium NML160702]|nr:alanine racemase [Aerococcaceae bacterium NML160702]
MIEPSEHRPTVAIVDLEAIQHNVHAFLKRMSPSQQLYVAVKANGYGHGITHVAQAALEAGASGLLVATVDEGITLRKNGVHAPILVLGLTDPRGIAEILHYQLMITVCSPDFFKRAQEQLAQTDQLDLLTTHRLTVHLALDTGMGRIGLTTVAEVEAFKDSVTAYDWVDWQGAFTHFSTAGGGPEDHVHAQWAKWQALTAVLPDSVAIRHYANSAMAMWYPQQPASDIVRLGIGLYGIDPKDRLDVPQAEALQPALQLLSEIVHVKQVPKGTKISYGATYEAQADEWIATVPIGYADGWFRHYRDIPVLVDGHACPIAGTINMDQMMIRLPKYYPVGTTVTLIGRSGHLDNHVSKLAAQLDTISYELLTSISTRVPRLYVKGESLC